MIFDIDVDQGLLVTRNASISLEGVTGCERAFEFISLMPLAICLFIFAVQFHGVFYWHELMAILTIAIALFLLSIGIVSIRVWLGGSQARVTYCTFWTAEGVKRKIQNHISEAEGRKKVSSIRGARRYVRRVA